MVAVSVVIVNLNGAGLLEDCLGALEIQTFRDFEVIFVDNGSTDRSVDRARALCPRASLLPLATNTGFARGTNLGIQKAAGRYVVLLNNDTRADPRFLEELVRVVEGDARAGMVSPKILDYYRPAVIDSVGGLVVSADGIGQGRGRGEEDRGQYDDLRDVLLPSGCAALYRREVFDEIGLFDEEFFAYCEDTDLGLRARWAGWLALSAPGAVVYHKYSASSGKYSPLKMFLVERNHYWVVLKNYPPAALLRLPGATLYRYALMACALLLRRGKGSAGSVGQLLGAFIRAHWAAAAGARRMFAGRARQRRIGNAQFAALLRQHRLPMHRVPLRD